MKSKLILLFGIILTQIVFSQEKAVEITKDKIIINMNTEILVDASIQKNKIYKFKLISEKKITKTFDLMELMNGEKMNMTNDIYIRFGKTDSGNPILILIHSFKKSIIYKAKIKRKGGQFRNTTIMKVHPNVPSTEYWNDDIETIELYEFKYSEN